MYLFLVVVYHKNWPLSSYVVVLFVYSEWGHQNNIFFENKVNLFHYICTMSSWHKLVVISKLIFHQYLLSSVYPLNNPCTLYVLQVSIYRKVLQYTIYHKVSCNTATAMWMMHTTSCDQSVIMETLLNALNNIVHVYIRARVLSTNAYSVCHFLGGWLVSDSKIIDLLLSESCRTKPQQIMLCMYQWSILVTAKRVRVKLNSFIYKKNFAGCYELGALFFKNH